MAVTVVEVDFHQHFVEVHAAVLGPGADFRHKRDCRHRVLVAGEGFGQESIRFFAAADIAFLTFEFADNACNPLEAGVAVIHLDALIVGDCLDGLCGHDCLNDIFVADELAQFAVAAHDVIHENHYNLVAVHELILALAVADDAADTVSIGVGCEDDVGVDFLALCDSHCHGRGIFRIGRVDGGEIAGCHILLRNIDDVGEAVVAQRVRNQFHAGAVNRGIDNLEVMLALDYLGIEREGLDVGKECGVDFFTDNLDELLVAVELDVLGTDAAYVIDDVDVVGSDNLRAIFPISLVAVVFLGVVGGGDVHAALATEFADCERKFGSGTEVIEKIHLDAVGREYVCDYFGKFA